jgi:diguanylate cyclase (GGDEF)-like protein
MNDLIETLRTAPRRPGVAIDRQAILVHIYPAGSAIGTRYVLGKTPLVIGRENDCAIQIQERSVSRRHARIQQECDGFHVFDLQSTNGTFVNDVPKLKCRLKDGDYVRVGNCIYRFLTGDNVEAAYHEEIYRRAIIDALTDVHNKRYLTEFLDRELARTERYRRPLALIMLDIDQFKAINDHRGHLAGDCTLRELAARIKKIISREQEFARYGGDEFSIIMPETNREDGLAFAERVRATVASAPFSYEDKSFQVTISLGLAFTTGAAQLTTAELLQQADQQLYEAKKAGRNRVAG